MRGMDYLIVNLSLPSENRKGITEKKKIVNHRVMSLQILNLNGIRLSTSTYVIRKSDFSKLKGLNLKVLGTPFKSVVIDAIKERVKSILGRTYKKETWKRKIKILKHLNAFYYELTGEPLEELKEFFGD